MKLEDELALSYYRPVADISKTHCVQLVQHLETNKFFVKKHLNVYNADIYRELQTNPARGIPGVVLIAEDETGLTVIEEYIQGDSLEEILKKSGTLSEEQTIDYTMKLLKIISDLHKRNPPIIHRDIKPGNIIITCDNSLKLVDMNTAKQASSDSFRDTTLLGTVGFASPEQFGFASSTERSDIYSTGVLMNVMLTGKLPGEKTADGMLSEVISRCTQMSPSDRYGSADELLNVVTSLSTGGNGARFCDQRKRFLPPGFRSGRVSRMIIALLGYALVFFIGFSLKMPYVPKTVLVMNRIAVMLIGLLIIFFSCDYLGIQERMPLLKVKGWLRIPIIILYDAVISLIILTILTLIETII